MPALWPILVVIGSNVIYNICAKQTDGRVNAFFSLALTYGVAMLLSLAAYFVSAADKNVLHELSKTNWASYLLGISIVGLEFGYIYIYRTGWKMSVASLTANVGLAVVLLAVGYLLYKETLTLRQLAGAAACAVGLFLLNQ